MSVCMGAQTAPEAGGRTGCCFGLGEGAAGGVTSWQCTVKNVGVGIYFGREVVRCASVLVFWC